MIEKKKFLTIIKKLTELELTIAYEPIKKLYVEMQKYINTGQRMQINIPFPMINKRIKGILAINKREQVFIKLENEK
jgi:hypothetical protein